MQAYLALLHLDGPNLSQTWHVLRAGTWCCVAKVKDLQMGKVRGAPDPPGCTVTLAPSVSPPTQELALEHQKQGILEETVALQRSSQLL